MAGDSPIVDEVRKRRYEISERFGHDLDAYCKHLREEEAKHRSRIVDQLTSVRSDLRIQTIQDVKEGCVKMPETIPIAATRWIRDCGFDEIWLQDQIAESPACLQLGELELVSRERQQAGGGRLDILLKDPQDDSMYEVEVMLGDTDETHIIRTIEYWDREKRKWPQRQHFAVLVASPLQAGSSTSYNS